MSDSAKKVKVKLGFEQCPDVLAIFSSGNIGLAGYNVIIMVDGTKNEFKLPPDASSFEFEAVPETQVIAAVSAMDRKGIHSLATHITFHVPPVTPPRRPRELTILSVRPVLDVIVDNTPPAPTQKLVLNAEEPYTITVSGHSALKDGAVGRIQGIDPVNRNLIRVEFPDNAFRAGCPTGTVVFDRRHSSGKVTVLSPSQEQMTLGEFFELTENVLEANTAKVA